MAEPDLHYPQLDPFSTGFRGCCPRCGQGRLFDGFLKVKPSCAACRLDYSFADAGEGPAVFVMLIVGFVVLGSALWLQLNYEPPVLLQAVIWIPVSVGLALFLLRAMKGVMIALQYRNNAGEGRIDRD